VLKKALRKQCLFLCPNLIVRYMEFAMSPLMFGRVLSRVLLPALLMCTSHAASAQSAQPELPSITLQAGMHLIKAELADDPGKRQTGLMMRKEMATNHGMLFVFDRPDVQCFWMKNTLLPLSIAFIADDGAIVNIADMQALSESNHCSAKPIRYALEMHQGWFAKRGIKTGFKLKGEPFSVRNNVQSSVQK
jgi:uncharacterized protein